MHHSFIDAYSDLNTPLHRINAKTKIIAALIFLLAVVLTPIKSGPVFLFYGVVIAAVVYISKIPAAFIFKRTAEIAPFIFIISLSALFKKGGCLLFLNLVIKAIMAMLLILIISSTTRFSSLINAFRALKMPRIFIDLLSFMYRYTFLLEDQIMMTRRACASRGIFRANNFGKVKALGNILGSIFIRTYERAERVYLAMCARGYNGE